MRIHRTFRHFACVVACLGAAAGGACAESGLQVLFAPASGSPYVVGSRPGDVAVADVNGDGAADVIAANAGDGSIGVLLGDGGGAFRPAPGNAPRIGVPPHLIAVGDFNSDSLLDLAASSHDSNDVFVLLGDGRGGFARAAGSPVAAFAGVKAHSHGLAVADVNGDGTLDLTLGHQETGAIAVLLGDGKGRFAAGPGSPLRLGRGFYPHALADVDGDGKIDLVAPDILGSAIVVALGDGRGGFSAAPGSPIAVKARPFYVLIADLNGDGRTDVAATHDDIDDVDVLLGEGGGRLKSNGGFHAGGLGWVIAAVPVNNDEHKDLLVLGEGALRGFLGDGRGGFASAGSPYPTPPDSWRFRLGDLNRDGRLDVVFAGPGTDKVTVLLHR
jgi:hypothetical protein